MAKYKVPSQAASGADTFSDNLVGNQITTGTGQLTNTNFTLDSEVIQRDTKNFKTNPFSNFLTLDDLKIETDTLSTDEIAKRKKEIKFKGSKGDAGKSLFGSLKSRLGVSTQNIVINFPAGILIDSTSLISTSGFTATNIVYNIQNDTTDFDVEYSMLYNPFSVITITPKSKDNTSSYNLIRDFYNSFKKYVITVSGKTYNITSYTEPNSKNVIKLKVKGKPFTTSTYSLDILIRPNDGIVEEFFKGLDDLEESLLNRDSSPIYTASFKVPRDSFDQTKTELISVNYTWPVSEKDNWNIKIAGLEYEDYLRKLSDISDEIDDYKSNLFVRFLTSPQLFEFDSPDKKAESVFQLYGQSFDKVKKYIDNIAYMRNVSYDGINNVPDILLKNLANTLGLDTVNLIDEKGLDELLYTKTSQQYSGLVSGTSLLDAEFEFYRRLLVNLAYIYKSKGTRQSLEFFLRFLGAPEPMISINQYVYKVKSYPKSFNLEEDIYRATTGKYLVTTATFLPTGGTINTVVNGVITGITYPAYSYYTGTTTGSTSLSMEGYPVNLITSQPKSVTGSTDLFFQKGSGWYDNTASHKSPLVIDKDLSSGTTINGEFVLTGRTKTSVTKNSAYTYGEDYFNLYRTLPGLDTGYDLETVIDNTQTQLVSDESHLILNRKNIEVYLSSAQVVDYDIYRKSRDLELTFGTNSLLPQTGVTFAEYVDLMIHQQIKNSNLIKYKKNYITLEDIYQDYIKHTNYTFPDINIFIEKMSPYWTSVIDQIIPSTTLWTGGNLISNNIFGRPKYQYKYGCQPIKTDDYLNFDLQIPTGYTSYFDYLIQQADDDLSFSIESDEDGETKHDGYVKLYPVFEIDGIVYSGMTDPTNASALNTTTNVTGCTYVLISGATSLTGTTLTFNNDNTVTTNGISVKLYSGGTTNDLSVYSEIDQQLKILWKRAIQNTITYINTCTGCTYSGLTIDQPGKNNEYADDIDNINLSGSTTYIETNFPHLIPQLDSSNKKLRKKILSYEFFIDNEGREKIKLTSYKYGPHDCTINEYLDYGYVSIGQNDVKDCRFSGGSATYWYGPTPTPTNTPIPTATPTTTPSPTPTPLPATATPTPSPSPLPATATPTVTPSPATYTPTPTNTNTPTPTPTPTPVCDFDVDLTIITSTPTPTPTPTVTPTPTPVCDFDVDLTIITSTPTPTPTPTVTPTPTPVCDFDVDLTIITSTPTPTPTPTVTPTPTPVCDFDVDLTIITSTPTPTPTPTVTPTPTPVCDFDVDLTIITSTPTPTPTPTVTPTPTPVCDFDVDLTIITSTPTPTPTPTVTPTPTPDCNFSVDVIVVNSTPTPTPSPVPVTDTPTPTPIPNLCNQYTIDNQTESPISISYYDCSGVLQSDSNLGSGQQITFCANQSYGPIEYSNGSLYDLGLCPTPTPTPTLAPTDTPTPTPTIDLYVYYNANVFDCTDCGPNVVPTSKVKFLAPFTPNNTLFYITNPLNGKFYRTTTQTTSQAATLLDTTEYSSCATACGFTPTPTPPPTDTPTPPPTDTPTPLPTDTPTPTPTPVLYSHSLGFVQGAFADRYGPAACSDYVSSPTTYYSNCSTLSNGCYLYSNNSGALVSQTGWFSNGSSYWVLDGPALPIRAQAPCPTTTPTPPPSATPTPSPTPDPNFYFLAERYECQLDGTCLYTQDLYISNPIDLSIFAQNPRFRLDPTSGYILRVINAVSPQIALITNMTGGGTLNCSSFCTQPATYTPTPTPLPLPATDTPTPSPTPCPSEGTFLMSTCDGYNLYYRFANGSCGTYDTFIESNSASCGYMTPTPTATPSLPDGVLDFGSSDSNFQQCGYGFDSNDYEHDRTYTVNFTSPRSSYGYVLVYLSDNSPLSIPFNQNDTAASLTVPCGCGSECNSIQYVMSIAYSTPTPTPEPLSPTSTPAPTEEGGGGGIDPI